MRRRIGFYIPRKNQIKVVGPVIAYMLQHCPNRFEIVIIFPGWTISKPELQPRSEDFTQLFGAQVKLSVLSDSSEFLKLIKTHTIDAVVNVTPQLAEIHGEEVTKIIGGSRRSGTKWVAVPHVFEEIILTMERPAMVAKNWDLICTIGPRCIEYVEACLSGVSAGVSHSLRERIVITGYPELDYIGHLDGNVIRKKYELPTKKPIVFLATAPSLSPLRGRSIDICGLEVRFRGFHDLSLDSLACWAASFRYPVLIPYRTYLSALREFADSNNACLIAKTRGKHSDPEYVSDYVDQIVGDISFFPFTTLELLNVSDLYFGFYSASVIEAVASGVYAVCCSCMPLKVLRSQARARLWSELFYHGEGGLWNSLGVSEMLSGTKLSDYNRLDRLREAKLDEYMVDEEKRKRVIDSYFSYMGRSSETFVNVLASLW